GERSGLVTRLDIVLQDKKFVAALAGKRIAAGQRTAKAMNTFAQVLVAARVPARAVDFLKEVDIDEKHCHHGLVAACLVQRFFELADNELAIGQASERIMRQLIDEHLLKAVAF